MIFSSCDVNTMKYHDGRTEVMQAKRKIRLGESSWLNYTSRKKIGTENLFLLPHLYFLKKLCKYLRPKQ